MADSYDVAMGLLGGLNKGILAYHDAKKSREDKAAEMAARGLIQDESGQWVQDPIYAAGETKKRQADLRAKAALEGRIPKFDESGEIIEAPRSPDELAYLKARDDSNPYRGLLQKMQIEENNRKKTDEAAAIQTPYGTANTPADANVVKEAEDARNALNDLVDQMISLRKENTGIRRFGPEANARGKQLAKQALLLKKKLDGLGVLSATDIDIVNSIVPEDPLKVEWFGDPTMKKLQGIKGDAQKKLGSVVSTRIRPGLLKNADKLAVPPVGGEGDGSVVDALQPGANADEGPQGKTITQDGHTYTWNPQTKKYE